MGHEALENCCQLHERVYIYYVVDGYIAKLCIWDDIACVIVATFWIGYCFGVRDKELDPQDWWMPLMVGGIMVLGVLAAKGILG